ncbi:hypothetical protein D3C81_1853140 [compost metagenome]
MKASADSTFTEVTGMNQASAHTAPPSLGNTYSVFTPCLAVCKVAAVQVQKHAEISLATNSEATSPLLEAKVRHCSR